MSKHVYRDEINEDIFEPAWPYDMADTYMEQDLGHEHGDSESHDAPVSFIVLKRPWFKQNYRTCPKKNLRLYRRPFFHVAEE